MPPVAAVHGKKASFSLNSVDISGWLNDASLAKAIDTAVTSTFQVAGDAKTFVLGLNSSTIPLTGLWDATVEATLDAVDSGGVAVPFIFGPAGTTAGLTKYTGNVLLTKYEVKTTISAANTITGELQVTGPVTRGVF